jgi:hypothetical protein
VSFGTAGRALVAERALAPSGAAAALEQWIRAGGDAVIFATSPADWSFPSLAGEPLSCGGLVRTAQTPGDGALDAELLAGSVVAGRAVDVRPGDTVMLRASSGEPLAVRRSLGAGTATVVGLDLVASNMPLVRSGSFPAFVEWLAGDDRRREAEVGDRLSGLAPGTVVIDGPDDPHGPLVAGADGAVVLRRPGVVRVDREGRREAIAVNIPRAESEPSSLADDELATSVRRAASPDAPPSASVLDEAESRQQIWRLLLAAALLVALVELFVATRGSGYPTVEAPE